MREPPTKMQSDFVQVDIRVALDSDLFGSERQLIQRYCVSCHNQRLKTAGLTLDTLDVTDVSIGPETWEKVVRKLRAGAMPPANAPRPGTTEYEHLAASIEAALDRVAAAQPRPGRVEPFHRLTHLLTRLDAWLCGAALPARAPGAGEGDRDG